MMKMRVRAIYAHEVLKPLQKLDLMEGEEVEIEISSMARKTRGIIRIDHGLAKEIAESDELSVLNA
ncbi:MAG: antitoxin family protein [Candidatus Methanoperedenaceae archaeon]|nr:antitoxin family protein [Candidatus Methanoperedenaceae archaeon]